MATILNIETSSSICSVAISREGVVEFQMEDTSGMRHAERLAPFIDRCMEEVHRREMPLDAVAVSLGPGSYTGLRIGLATAKGLCFGLGIPLIGVDTLQLLAVKAMFRSMDWQGDEILIPMVDARRLEVYTCAYDFALNELMPPGPMILDADSYRELRDTGKAYFMGDAVEKARTVIDAPADHWIDNIRAHARDMVALSEKAFREGNFIDVAYSVPLYRKEYQTTKPRNKVLSEAVKG